MTGSPESWSICAVSTLGPESGSWDDNSSQGWAKSTSSKMKKWGAESRDRKWREEIKKIKFDQQRDSLHFPFSLSTVPLNSLFAERRVERREECGELIVELERGDNKKEGNEEE